jgi:hypothetical protein
MFTSEQINQQISGYSYGFGPMGAPQWRADSGFMGATPWGPGAGDAFASGAIGGTTSVVNASQMIGMGAAAANFAGTKMGLAVPRAVSNLRYMAGFGMSLGPQIGIMAGVHALNGMNQGAQDQFRINEIVSQQLGNRINMGGRGTIGASRAGMQQIGDLTREMSQLPELLSSVSELSALMDKMGQAGMITGVKSIADFRNKFRQGINSLRDMSKVLGSTMDEALTVAAELQTMGIVGGADKLRAVLNRQATSMMGVGMAPEVVMQGMANGAQLAGAMGNKSRIAGVAGAAKTMQTFSTAMQMGVLDEQTIADLTGLTGDKGIAALSSMTQERVTGMVMNSGLGQAMTAAMGEVRDGKYTGKLDKDIVEKVRTGQLSKDQLIKMANEKLSAKGAASSFSQKKSGMSFKAAQEVGLEGVLAQIQQMSEEASMGDEALVAIVAKNFLGGDQTLADTLIQVAGRMRDIDVKNKKDYQRAIEAKISQEKYKRDFTVGGKFEQFTHAMGHVFVAPFERAGAQLAYSMGQTGDEISNFITRGFSERVENVQYSDTDRIRAARAIGTGDMTIRGLREVDKSVINKNVLQTMNISQEQRAMIESIAGKLDPLSLTRELNKAGTQAEKEQVLKDAVLSTSGINLDSLNSLTMTDLGSVRSGYDKASKLRGMQTETALSAILETSKLTLGQGTALGEMRVTPNMSQLGAELTTEQEKNIIDDLVDRNFYTDYTGTFNDETLMPFLQEHSTASDLFLDALSTGKIGGVDVSQFALFSKEKQMGLLKSLGLDETAANNLISQLTSDDFFAARKNEGDVATAKKLKDSRTRGAAKLIQQDLAMMVGSLLTTDPAAAAALEQFAQGNDAALFSMLEGKGKLGNEELGRARSALQGISRVADKFKTGSSQSEFIKELGLTEQSVSDLIDSNDVLSADERTKLLDVAKRSGVMNQLSSRSATGGFGAKTAQEVKDESIRLMVQTNTEFVRAVEIAVPALKEVTAEKLKAVEPK